MNRLHELNESRAGRVDLGVALDNLMNVTIRHFADEEVYQKSIQFPGASKHALIHKQLLERMEQYRSQFRSNGVLVPDFFAFLKMWLKSHICGIDTKYAEFSRAS